MKHRTSHPLPLSLLLSLLAVMLALFSGCAGNKPAVPAPVVSTNAQGTAPTPGFPVTDLHTPPPAPREFRAAWVASVGNIDWPSRKDLSVAQQQAEIIAILDTAKSMRLNAIVLQVRPAADALYPSTLEPWSEYLTGEQGKPPRPYYDPLKMWIDEAHLRGLELHAWFNPYRARTVANSKSPAAASHVSKQRPAIVKQYGDMLWMDPGEPLAAKQTLAVITDVVRRYDVDGIHIDDYFYPYPVNDAKGSEQDFPDEVSWQRYLKDGGKLARADWRRQNVDRLIAQIHAEVHKEKSWVKFGVSPFGIGRPDRLPPGITGFSQYDKLYADVELWLQNGWLDYLAPQLYWPIDQAPQAYKTLLDYWIAQNTQGRHLWAGLYTGRITDTEQSWQPQEILNQIAATRDRPGSGGNLHFSMTVLMKDKKNIRDLLQQGPYQNVALVPATPWLGNTPPAAPALTVDSSAAANAKTPVMTAKAAAGTSLLAVWKRYGKLWQFSVQPASNTLISTANDPVYGALQEIQISAVDRLGNESPRVPHEFH
ncbi:glycoside hydrolase family 10 protein [Undibacterium sp. TJN25]|uniref:glycoside hydrolase family 10 protein n=1 Tax=Undibacterium sp. TJN25 TaxID=3413056 RepID=UPI003BF3CAC4